MSKLFHLVPNDGTAVIPIDKPLMFVGRHSDCDIDLTNSRKVSRKHCCLAQVNSTVVIRDLGSTNGVKVRGKVIRKETKINIGDDLHIGDCEFKLQLLAVEKRGGTARPPAAPPSPPKRSVFKVDPAMLSQDLPVVIDEQAEEFGVEETSAMKRPAPPKTISGRRSRSTDDDVIELDDADMIE